VAGRFPRGGCGLLLGVRLIHSRATEPRNTLTPRFDKAEVRFAEPDGIIDLVGRALAG